RTVERRDRRDVGAEPHGQGVRNPAAEAETSRADLPRAVRTHLEPERGRHEVFSHLVAIDLAEELAAGIVVTWIPSDRREPVGRKRDEVGEREPARDVLDMRVQAAILVDDHHARALGRGSGARRLYEIAPDRAIVLWRNNRGVVG